MDRRTTLLLTIIAIALVWDGVESDFSRYRPVPVEVKGHVRAC